MVIQWQDRITVDPNVMFGKPVIKGTRIPVELILEKLANGETYDQLLKSYPRIKKEDISACLFYAQYSIKNDIIYTATI